MQKNLKKSKSKSTSINIPVKIFDRIDNFASSVGINRNAAMIYLLSRGLEYEYDFENYMQKRKRKLDDTLITDAVAYSDRRRPYHQEYEVKERRRY